MLTRKTRASRDTKRGRWSQADRARLRELYGLREDALIARELKRPVSGVARVAESLFPALPSRTGPWTASEVQELKRYLGASSHDVIARILGRTAVEVQEQIFDLGRIQRRSDWTREEVAQLKRIYSSRTDEDLACVFGRSLDEIRRFSAEHGLFKDKGFMRKLRGEPATRMPRWTEEELDILRASYASEPNLDIAKRLGRSVKSVVSKAHLLELQKSSERLREMGRANVSVRYLPS
ncbi:MAG: hypothetical protein EXS08_08875 [Planctomycetes bacterium]|nr:hypothetical protein [Planctomycetota bacterium]